MADKSQEELLNELVKQGNRKKTNHVLHLLLSLVTVGFWIPVWILVAINNRTSNAIHRR